MKHKSRHKKFMKKALREARLGLFTTGANPRVGCVLVKDGTIIAQAHHQRVGEPHAEALALQAAGLAAAGSTAYVTLEPCSHVGKNPPCADALIRAQVSQVVVCNDDPNPLVAGQGYAKLRAAGIEVITGVCAKQGRDLNRGFLHRMQTGLPWVRCKLAQSLDGRTAMASGESVWITGPAARADVQQWRARSAAIITGIETVIQDDCRLTVRPDAWPRKYRHHVHDFEHNQPLRVIIDSQLRTPVSAKILQQSAPVLICTAREEPDKIAAYQDLGVTVRVMPGPKQRVDLHQVVRYLGMQACNEVLVEAGATLAGAFLDANITDELIVYTAPVIMGSSGRPLLKIDIEEMSDRLHIKAISTKSMGKDWRLRALVAK